MICTGWLSVSNEKSLILSKLACSTSEHVEIGVSLVVDENLQWKVLVRGRKVDVLMGPLTVIPSPLSSLSNLRKLIDTLDKSVICVGNNDKKYLPLLSSRKNCFYDMSGELQCKQLFVLQDVSYWLHAVGEGIRCPACSNFRKTLNAKLYRSRTTISQDR